MDMVGAGRDGRAGEGWDGRRGAGRGRLGWEGMWEKGLGEWVGCLEGDGSSAR